MLERGWEAAPAAPGERPADGAWLPARVPGTAAAVLRDAGRWEPGDEHDFDAEDWWFRTRFDRPEHDATHLRLGGIATVADVYLNGIAVLESRSMFTAHEIDVAEHLRESNELTIRCRALGPLLAERRNPRARWRTRVADNNLRFFRTSILGRAPGFAPHPAPVGPWRPVSLERPGALRGLEVRTRVDGDDGVLTGRAHSGAPVEVECDGQVATGELVLRNVERWWPHTHGEPRLYDVRVHVTGEVAERRVGFRTLSSPGDVRTDGLDLHVNGARIFARGAVWTPVDATSLAPSHEALRRAVEQARDAGMNMLRVAGIGVYESAAFHDLCDELGILVWQDFMFANMDYPIDDEGFRTVVEEEARDVLAHVAGRPSLAVVCGNSEIEQQVAMLGLDPALARGPLFEELLPGLVRDAATDAVYVPSAPTGGELPFHPGTGIANYFGVGGYRRPLEDARRAGVRFASECLAFANLPDDAPASDREGVARDVGSDWDFQDVRDHYLALLYDVDPDELRRDDPARYLELSRAVTGEVMGEVFGEWRRAGSPCNGALVLWLRDLLPGAGWGVVDHRGAPKIALHHLRRALAPVAVWTVDEGQNGIDVHVANDRPDPLAARLRVALYRDLELCVERVEEVLHVPPRSSELRNVEAMLGRFVDAAWAYRFGPPGHDVIVASLLSADGPELLSQALRFPAGRPRIAESAETLGLEAVLRGTALTLRSRRLAYGVRIHVPGLHPDDDAFSIEPGGERTVQLRAHDGAGGPNAGTVTALNLAGSVAIR